MGRFSGVLQYCGTICYASDTLLGKISFGKLDFYKIS